MKTFLQFLQEHTDKINELYLLEKTLLCEVGLHQLKTLVDVISRTASRYKLNLVTTAHGFMRLIINDDPSRTNIDALNLYESIKRFLEKESKVFEQHKQKRKEYVGVITDPKTNLNVVLSIAFDKRPDNMGNYDFKLITAMVKKNYGSDNHIQHKVFV